ncbi:hypothetical protein RIF23_09875 [Lipingzhangella sp. LS1_29]|uniref:Small CPxCG-related zinc finger protein n=1 Tax=Lipingzhangella rawalii TaxID=2055835 RepID=A0ABU2H704_9ACTN|nr:hypothetical protein [Lipingzhangella rawalii]MDS1270605.1 hypothetical protein [Lipingzhangella rawalii]
MRGLSTEPMVHPHPADDPCASEALTAEQAIGEACGICHARWPLPQVPLVESAEDAPLYVCRDCATLAGVATPRPARRSLAVH